MPHEMTRNLLLVLLGAVLGGGLVAWALDSGPPSPVPDSPGPSPALLAPALPSPGATSARIPPVEPLPPHAKDSGGLRREIQALQAELEQERDRGRALAEAIAEAGMDSAAPRPDAGDPEQAGAPPWFNAAALEDAGWSAGEVQRIRSRWEEYEMAKLEVENDRARKVPGWKHLGKRSFEIEVEVRQDLGDEGYEAMRYAASQPNRVVVVELLGSSPAAQAGIEAGDEVVSYDGQRIFSASALKYLTHADVPGALTEIRVMRGDEERRFFVPRGPMGTRLGVLSRPPFQR